jgi:hypothetical protein
MAGYAYRLPRKYRYRHRGKLSNRDALVITVIVIVAAGAASGHKAVAGAVHDGATRVAAAGVGPVTVASGSQPAFIRAVLADLGAPDTQADVTSLASWFPHEGTAAENNPMASTMPEPGATIFNYDGVRNYVSPSQGAQATAATLDDGDYPLIVAALRSGAGLCGNPSLAGEFLTWSGGGYSEVC